MHCYNSVTHIHSKEVLYIVESVTIDYGSIMNFFSYFRSVRPPHPNKFGPCFIPGLLPFRQHVKWKPQQTPDAEHNR